MHRNEDGTIFPPRLPGYDYSTPGFYFVTICTYQQPGTIHHPSYLNPRRDTEFVQNIITAAWEALPRYFPNLVVDERVIMPNHLHFLIQLLETDKERANLSMAMKRFKGRTTSFWNKWYKKTLRKAPPEHLWQRSFYDRIIRDEEHLKTTREYILNNPLKALEQQNEDHSCTKESSNQLAK